MYTLKLRARAIGGTIVDYAAASGALHRAVITPLSHQADRYDMLSMPVVAGILHCVDGNIKFDGHCMITVGSTWSTATPRTKVAAERACAWVIFAYCDELFKLRARSRGAFQ
eukprot:6195110-Pleurochrysis_carterae.AAC.1